MARKRKRSISGDGERRAPSRNSNKNPFLEPSVSTTSNSDPDNNNILTNVLEFLEASGSRSRSHENSNGDDKLIVSLNALLGYLDTQNHASNPDNPAGETNSSLLVSATDVGNLLLPWATTSLIKGASKQSDTLDDPISARCWITLEKCLNTLLPSRNEPNPQIGTLSQSVLNKLVPYAAKVALLSCDVSVISSPSRCYCLLVDRLYRPTMDLACNSLVSLVQERLCVLQDKKLISDGGSLCTKHLNVVASTVGLLRHLQVQAIANPKKVFLLLSGAKVLSSLAYFNSTEGEEEKVEQIQDTISQLIWEGWFSPVYHMEGFRSLVWSVPKFDDIPPSEEKIPACDKKAFHCYQENLLETIKAMIEGTTQEKIVNEKQLAIAVVQMVPAILRGFLSYSAIWDRDYRVSSQRHRGIRNELSTLQFRFFSNITFPLIRRLGSSVRLQLKNETGATLAFVKALRGSLTLVLENDCYLPSYSDKDNVHINFLKDVTEELLRLVDTIKQPALRRDLVACVETLVLLNHYTVHDKLADVIRRSLVCPCAINNTKYVPEGADLLFTFVTTYRRLRQLDHLFVSMLEAVGTQAASGRSTESIKEASQAIDSFNKAMKHSKVLRALEMSVRECPQGQVKELFQKLTSWISSQVGMLQVSSPAVSFGADLFGILIKNVRVDKQTAPVIARSIVSSIENCISPSLDKASESGTDSTSLNIHVKRHVLVVFGRLIELHTRCLFWLYDVESAEETEISRFSFVYAPLVEKLLVHTPQKSTLLNSADHPDDAMLGELQFLACYRLQHLYSLLHNQTRNDQVKAVEGKEQGDALFLEEESRLVRFIFVAADQCVLFDNDAGSSSWVGGWKLLAANIPYWLPYANSGNIKSFLRRMFGSLGTLENECKSSDFDSQVASSQFRTDQATAMALLRDASFFEFPEIATQFCSVGMGYVVEQMRIAFCGDDQASIVVGGLNLLIGCADKDWCLSSPKQVSRLMQTTELSTIIWEKVSAPVMRKILRILLILNGAPVHANDSKRSLVAFDVAMRLDTLVRLACIHLVSHRQVACDLLCCLRSFASARLLEIKGQKERNQLFNDVRGDRIRGLLFGLLHSVSATSSSHDIPDCLQSRLRLTAGQLLDAVVVVYATPDEPEGQLSKLLGCIQNDWFGRDKVVTCETIVLARSIVRRLCTLLERGKMLMEHKLKDDGSVIESIRSRLLALGPELESRPVGEWLCLIGDTSRLSFLVKGGLNATSSYEPVKAYLSSGDERDELATSYFLACLVASEEMSKDTSEIVLKRCLSVDVVDDQLLGAAFCGLVPQLRHDEINAFLERLVEFSRSSRGVGPTLPVSIFHRLVTTTKTTEQRKEVASFAPHFFTLALELLQPVNSNPDMSSNVAIATKFIIALTYHKDIIPIGERDLAMIMAQISATLRSKTDKVGDEVYTHCFFLVSSLLQRFSKQLYACVPSVVATVHSFLLHALYESMAESAMADRAQKFTRLCELLIPHREIYKKHILGLLLEFVRAIAEDLNPVQKKGIERGVYCLLDILSEFETKQLNAIMDTSGKAMFRTVYQNYQKLHLYKGQY